MTRRKPRATRKGLVESRAPGAGAAPGDLPSWVGQTFGVALILGDFFLGGRMVASFEAFSGSGLSGLQDPWALAMLAGLVGWWVVVLPMGRTWAAAPDRAPPMSTGAQITALVVALVTSVLVASGLAEVVPELAMTRGGEANPLGIGLVTVLFLALAGLQWWRLQAWDPVPEDPEEALDEVPEAPGLGASREPSGGAPGKPPAPEGSQGRVAPPSVGVRLVAALLLLPAGWALLAPGDLLAERSLQGIAVNWQGALEQVGAAALVSVFSAGFGALLALGPRALASRILGEGLTGGRFLVGLWLAHWLHLSLSLLRR